MGRGAHRQHDGNAPGLVYLAATRVGCAHRGVHLRRMQEHPESPEVHQAVVDLFATKGADAWYRSAGADLPARNEMPVRQHEFRKEMDIIDVWFESGSSYLAVQRHEGYGHILLISTLKVATSIADGSTLPCSAPSAREAARHIKVCHRRLDARRTRPRAVEVARQYDLIRWTSLNAGGGDCPPVGFLGRLPRRCG